MNTYPQLPFLILAFILTGHHAYVAWVKPEQHKLDLAAMGKWYRSWSPYTEQWVASTFGFWLTRFAYLLAFFIVTIALIDEIAAYFSGNR